MCLPISFLKCIVKFNAFVTIMVGVMALITGIITGISTGGD
jgi:hypothetical protein